MAAAVGAIYTEIDLHVMKTPWFGVLAEFFSFSCGYMADLPHVSQVHFSGMLQKKDLLQSPSSWQKCGLLQMSIFMFNIACIKEWFIWSPVFGCLGPGVRQQTWKKDCYSQQGTIETGCNCHPRMTPTCMCEYGPCTCKHGRNIQQYTASSAQKYRGSQEPSCFRISWCYQNCRKVCQLQNMANPGWP